MGHCCKRDVCAITGCQCPQPCSEAGGVEGEGAAAVTMVSGGTITTITALQGHKRAQDTTITGITTVGTIEFAHQNKWDQNIKYFNYHVHVKMVLRVVNNMTVPVIMMCLFLSPLDLQAY